MLNVPKSIAVVLLSLLLHLYLYHSEHVKKFDYEFYDALAMILNKLERDESTSYTIIVDIDEKSIEELGQWPWSRVIDAQLIDIIHEMNPSALGVNILFSERDRVSPLAIQNFYQKFFDLKIDCIDLPERLKDNDKFLSESLHQAEATLSTYFRNSTYNSFHCQNLSYKHNLFSTIKTEFSATSLLCNYKTIQEGIENFGFINAGADSDGIFRRIPLFINYNQQVFPSFALATLLSFDKYVKIKKEESTILVNFSQKKPKVFSAVDLLMGRVSKDEIQGKIVILGSSIVGLNPTYIIPSSEKISNSMIHAFVIDNILTNTLLTQPKKYRWIDTFLSFILSIFIIVLLDKRLYLNILTLLLSLSTISVVWVVISYLNGIYISIGYLWIPFLYFLTAILAYHMQIRSQEKIEKEKILIRQSKLASMGEMISLIAHQWRQPLSAINGIVLNIDIDHRKEILHTNRLNEHLNQIEETTAYLSKTITDFSDFFSQNKNKEYFYIRDTIRQTKKLIPISNDKNIKINYRTREEIEILGYKSELIQALLIILNNAIYACQKNIQNTKQGQIFIETKVSKKNLLILIEDNGGGINSKNIKHIFNPYFTTKEKPHGTGLGLYILRLIVEDSMYGKISVRNGKEGALFTIQIPSKS